MNCPFFTAIELTFRVTNRALQLVEPLIAPIAAPIWDRLAVLAVPPVTTESS